MEREKIVAEVIKCAKEHFWGDTENITESTSFLADLGSDSLDFVEIVMELEDKFSVEIMDRDLNGVITIGNMADVIAAKLKQ